MLKTAADWKSAWNFPQVKWRIDMDWILIVEDDELIAELERDYLLAEGMGSDIVSDGCEAVMQFRKRKYAAVLLDLMLPGKSGFDIAGR